jgi:hypothetical protein
MGVGLFVRDMGSWVVEVGDGDGVYGSDSTQTDLSWNQGQTAGHWERHG